VEHEGYRPHQSTDDECHGGGQDYQQLGIGRSLQLGTAMPPSVLLTELDNGTLVLQGRPDGPRVRLSLTDAVPLKRELAAALERTATDDQDAP
jgi:hypothetical protein